VKRSKLFFWLFLFPALFAFLVVEIIPTLVGIWYSFTDWNGISLEKNFVALQNYRAIFSDSQFLYSFAFTALFAVAAVVFINLVGFSLALLVTGGMRGSNLLRGIFFMPNLIGGILLGFIWNFIFTRVFEYMGKTFGVSWLQGWLSTTETGFFGLLIVMIWQLSGYMMIIYIAQLQNIPDSVKEAAAIDGATGIQQLWHITIPLVAPACTIGLFLSLSNAFKLFDQNLALTAGGPHKSTMMLALNIYNTAFSQNQLGLAQAKAVIFLLAVAVISLTQLAASKKREVEM